MSTHLSLSKYLAIMPRCFVQPLSVDSSAINEKVVLKRCVINWN